MSLGETTSGKKNHRRVDRTESKDMADKTDGTDRTDMQNIYVTFNLDFPRHLCRAAFATLAMFF